MTEKTPARFKHFANIGDIIASLPTVKTFYEKTKRKVIFCQQLNVKGEYFQGATHPTLDADGQQVMCNQSMFDMIKPLLVSQPYIHDAEVYNGQHININLDNIRSGAFVNMPNGAIQAWHFLDKPDMAYDLSKPWIEIGEVDIKECGFIYDGMATSMLRAEDIERRVIINFTERYRNAALNYFFLKKHEGVLVFAGTAKEHELFSKAWGLDIPRLHVTNFLQLAYILKKARFLISNQSFCWNLAEAMKTPRILEYCSYAPNCQAFIGEHSYGYYKQSGVEYYFELLMEKKIKNAKKDIIR